MQINMTEIHKALLKKKHMQSIFEILAFSKGFKVQFNSNKQQSRLLVHLGTFSLF